MVFGCKATCIVSQIMSKHDQTWIYNVKKKLLQKKKMAYLTNLSYLSSCPTISEGTAEGETIRNRKISRKI